MTGLPRFQINPMFEGVFSPVILSTKATGRRLPEPDMSLDVQSSARALAIDLQLNDIIAGFPGRFVPVRMRSARREADPVPAHDDTISMYVPENLHGSNVVEMVLECLFLA